jgi:hypothetical protein
LPGRGSRRGGGRSMRSPTSAIAATRALRKLAADEVERSTE